MRPIDFAIQEIGKEEVPRGSNWGPSVQKYLRSVGINFPAAWCMAFVYWCFEGWESMTATENPLIKTGSVLQQWSQISKKYKVDMAAEPLYIDRGDIFIMDFGGGLGHCGFVEKFNTETGLLETIEGNTNDEGVRDGFEVCRRTRKLSSIKGLIRILIET